MRRKKKMLNILKVTSITSKRQNIRFCNTFYYIIYTQQLLFFFYFAAADDDDDDICTYIQMYVYCKIISISETRLMS